MEIIIFALGICVFILGGVIVASILDKTTERLSFLALLFSVLFIYLITCVNAFFNKDIVTSEYTKVKEAIPFTLVDKKYACKKYKYSKDICTLIATQKRYVRIENSEWKNLE